MLRLIARLCIYSGLLYGGVRFFEWKNVYHPLRELEFTPADAGLDFEDVIFVASDDVELHGWWMPHPEARGTVIMFHGNAGNIGTRVWMAADLQRMNLNVFLFDYRGYGRSRGIASERGTYRDGAAAYEFVRAKYGDAEQPPVLLYGRSLGAAIALQCALDKPVKGLIMESAFASIEAMGRSMFPYLPVSLIARYKYDNISKIRNLKCPLLMSSSTADTLVPYEQTRSVFTAAPEPKFWSDLIGDHNDSGWHSSPEYWRQIIDFVDFALKGD
jgi:uncharacterized protein